jgi:dTDP-4-amino-4,6-dideoxygalactose transaminase
MNKTLWLGIYPEISQEMLEYVATEIEFFFGENK